MLSSSTKSVPIFLTACLLAGVAISLVQAQETPGEILSISRTGHFPAIDADNRGGFVLAWTNVDNSDQEIYGALLAPERNFPGPLFVVNTRLDGIQTNPAIAAGPRGDFMVVWQGGTFSDPTGGDGDRDGVFGQAFSRNGAKLGPQRRLSEGIRARQVSPGVAALEDGSFVAVWQDQRTLKFEIITRRFSATGEPLGPERRMTVDGEYNLGGQVAAYPGGFVVSWEEGFGCSGGRSDSRRAVIARFDPSGRRVGRELRTGSLECGRGSGVTALVGSRAGALAILRSPAGYSAQRFGPSGELTGREIPLSRRICSESRCDFIASLAMDDRGRFAVLWEVSGAARRSFFAQVFTPRGRALTDRIPVGSTIPATLSSGSIALTNEGDLAVVWRRESVEDPEETGFYLWRLQLP